jgi:CRISPR-associated protein Cmr2
MNQKYLLAVALGPVQDFIAAARRTSDLTAGSQLLVDIAQATAEAIKDAGGELIFPAVVNGKVSDGPNKILAALPVGSDPKAIAEIAKSAARAKLREEWAKVLTKVTQEYLLNEGLATQQIEAFLECYTAGMPFTDATYATARLQVDALLAGRKNLRDFAPLEQPCNLKVKGKSPLDPAFECVLDEIPDDDTGILKLRKTEYLDAVSILKRAKGRNQKVQSTRTFARRHSEPGFTKDEWDDIEDDSPEKYPYYAILVADGDNMGKLLGKMDSIGQHQRFSQDLAEFATQVGGIVPKHDGYKVYAGGDDVLALLPVRTAIACAQELAQAFTNKVGATLSAGIAVVHYRQPLSLSLEMARAAEKQAKDGGRDSLCLAIHTRGGTPLHITQKWKEWETFRTWTEAFQEGSLTRGVAYELRDLAREFERVQGKDNFPERLLALEACRIWGRKQAQEGKKPPPFPSETVTTPKALAQFADLLIAARFLTAEGEN